MTKYIYSLLLVFIASALWGQDDNIQDDSFKPIPGQEYVVQAWVKDELAGNRSGDFVFTSQVQVINTHSNGEVDIYPEASGDMTLNSVVIDGWKLIQYVINLHRDTSKLEIKLIPGESGVTYFDDIRFFPFNGNLKSFVYDPENQRLLAELDENNYATFYEYDYEGGLVRVKKETERGVKTIQETRSSSSKINNN